MTGAKHRMNVLKALKTCLAATLSHEYRCNDESSSWYHQNMLEFASTLQITVLHLKKVDFYIRSGLAVINLMQLEGRLNIQIFLMRVGLLGNILMHFNHGRSL